MNNLGEGVRFYQGEDLDYTYVAGNFGIQIRYPDDPDSETLDERMELLKEAFPDDKIDTPGDYISVMIGDASDLLGNIQQLIFLIVLGVNILVTVLMTKNFLIREKSEIAILKAMGFGNSSLILWQSLRIGIVQALSILLATLLSTPLCHLCIEPIFQQMGASSITFEIRPLEVFVLYPLIMLGITVLTAVLTALQLRHIHASDTASMD